jgi:hypothetical protein
MRNNHSTRTEPPIEDTKTGIHLISPDPEPGNAYQEIINKHKVKPITTSYCVYEGAIDGNFVFHLSAIDTI